MDWTTFAAEVVKAVAWPAASLIALTMLRNPIMKLIPLMQRLKYKDFELQFGKQIEEVKAEAAIELPPSAVRLLPASESNALLELARVSPRSAVTEAWREVESATQEASMAVAVPVAVSDISMRGTTPSATRLIRELARGGTVDSGVVAVFHDLRTLRNQAVHSPEFALTTDAALEYAQVARQLAQHLRTVAREASAQNEQSGR